MKPIYVFFLLFISGILLADEIHLIDNTVHKCTITNVTSDIVEYKTPENTKEKISRDHVEKIVYDSGKEIEFYDKIFLADGSVIKGKVIKSGEEYLEYNPSGTVPYDKIEVSGIIKIVYDSGKVHNYKKSADTDIIYFKDGTTIKAMGIVINNLKNIEFYNENNIKQFYGLNLIEKIVYRDGRTEYPENMKSDDKKQAVSADKKTSGKSPDSFFEFECGWNGYAGLGARFDYLLFNNVSLNGAAGLGLIWGYRVSGSLRYYLEYPYGLAFSAGVAYNTGGEYKIKMETQDPSSGSTFNEKVTFDLKPVTCINASLLYSVQVNGNNKIYIETGYSYALQKENYTYTTESGRELSDESKNKMKKLAPGGFMYTVGYAFAI